MRQHDYQRALSVYELWGMTGAEAGDYRAAAGTALAAHKSDLADHFLEQGLQHYPNDPDLLQMTAKQAVAHGKYKEAQGYLKSALRATRNPDVNKQQSFRGGEQDNSKHGARPLPAAVLIQPLALQSLHL